MKIDYRKIGLVVAIILIIGAIMYLQKDRVQIMNNGAGELSEEALLKVESEDEETASRLRKKSEDYIQAPELQGIVGYLNTNGEEIKLQDYVGEKIILIDFWTYSCINCQRTFPYLTSWWEKYKDDGLLIIGVHSPEFTFEEKRENVERAILQHGITYPVVQDNNFATWRAYRNRYWPAKYLIDIDGFFVWGHFGEGKYEETEQRIQDLLEERRKILGEKESNGDSSFVEEIERPDFSQIGTSEVYFGYIFAENRNLIGNEEGFDPEKEVEYELPKERDRKENFAYIDGVWYNHGDYMELRSESGTVTLKYNARIANIVAGSVGEAVTIQVTNDGVLELIDVKDETLYEIASNDDYGTHDLVIEAEKGFRIYTFTFG